MIDTNNFRRNNRGWGVKCVDISNLPSIQHLIAILIAIINTIKTIDSDTIFYPPKLVEENSLNL